MAYRKLRMTPVRDESTVVPRSRKGVVPIGAEQFGGPLTRTTIQDIVGTWLMVHKKS